jgi:type IV pilus assembly protein PilW
MEGIVDLQAQYGISALASSNAIVAWVDATNAWAAPTVASRNLIKAVRFAVVARNPKKEANAVTTVCTGANTPGLSGLCAWQGDATSPAPTINLAAGDADWLKYRYRVFETIIPLRNVIWSGGPKGTL